MDTNKVINITVPENQKLEAGVPLEILEQHCRRQATGRLQFFSNSVSWTIRLELGIITYATHSVEPFDRLSCHLRYISSEIPSLTKEFRSQLCLMFEDGKDPTTENINGDDEPEAIYQSNDYAALCWLVTQNHLTYAQVATVIEGMTKEAIEPLFWLDQVTYRFGARLGNPITLYRSDLSSIVAYCQQRLRLWQLLTPQIWSPYQRPYFFGQTATQKQLLPELQLHEKFSTILKGYNFRHLAVLLNKKDELKIAGSLMPYICEEVVVLRDPQSPFDKLPKVPASLPLSFQKLSTKTFGSQTNQLDFNYKSDDDNVLDSPVSTSTYTIYTIVCVDDSPTILSEINRFLDKSNFKVIAISDPLKALMQITSVNPDLILLDVTMPKVNGYELCRLIKNRKTFKNTPIIMVTGNTSLIDRAKAKMSGAVDYLTKPFTQEGLLKMIFRYLD